MSQSSLNLNPKCPIKVKGPRIRISSVFGVWDVCSHSQLGANRVHINSWFQDFSSLVEINCKSIHIDLFTRTWSSSSPCLWPVDEEWVCIIVVKHRGWLSRRDNSLITLSNCDLQTQSLPGCIQKAHCSNIFPSKHLVISLFIVIHSVDIHSHLFLHATVF